MYKHWHTALAVTLFASLIGLGVSAGHQRDASTPTIEVVTIDTTPLVASTPASRPLPPVPLPIRSAAQHKPVCDAQCARWVAISLWRKALADNPPSGCPGYVECYRGGIKSKRPCAIPDYICHREAKLYIDVGNPSSTAAGKYQFVIRTWRHAVIGAGFPQWANTHAAMAPEYVQDAAASFLWDGGRGCGHWSAC